MTDDIFKIVSVTLLTLVLISVSAIRSECKADPYVAIGQGLFTPNIDPQYIVGAQTVDDATKPVSHIAIGYFINDDWAIELGHESFGTFGYRAFKPSEGQINASIKAQTFYIAGVRYFGPIYTMFGLHRWTTDADIFRSIAGQNNQHVTGSDGMLGIGWDKDIFGHVGIRLSYTKFMGIGNQSLIGSKTDAGVVGLAVVIR